MSNKLIKHQKTEEISAEKRNIVCIIKQKAQKSLTLKMYHV